jgi:hypothetical protein
MKQVPMKYIHMLLAAIYAACIAAIAARTVSSLVWAKGEIAVMKQVPMKYIHMLVAALLPLLPFSVRPLCLHTAHCTTASVLAP